MFIIPALSCLRFKSILFLVKLKINPSSGFFYNFETSNQGTGKTERKCERENRHSSWSLRLTVSSQAVSAEERQLLCNIFGNSSTAVKMPFVLWASFRCLLNLPFELSKTWWAAQSGNDIPYLAKYPGENLFHGPMQWPGHWILMSSELLKHVTGYQMKWLGVCWGIITRY